MEAPPKTDAVEEVKPEKTSEPDLAQPTAPEPEAKPSGAITGITESDWAKVLENIKRRSVPLYAYLYEGRLYSSTANEVVIVFPDTHEIHRNAVNEKESYALIKEELERLTLTDTHLQFIVERERKDKKEASLQDVIDLFGAENIEFK